MKLTDAQQVYLGRTGIQPCYDPSFLGNPDGVRTPGNSVTIIYGRDPGGRMLGGGVKPFGVVYFDPALLSWVVAFRGTINLSEWFLDALAFFVSCGWLNRGRVHLGFSGLYNTMTAGGMPLGVFLRTLTGGPIIVQGHSLGGAMAVCAAGDIGSGCTLLLWACPRVHDDDGAAIVFSRCSDVYRPVNIRDWVPDLAERLLPLEPWQHVGPARELDSAGLTISSIHAYHSMSTYLHLLDATQPIDPEFLAAA